MIIKFLTSLILLILTIDGYAAPLSLADVKEGFVETQDARLFYRTLGNGDPLIVLHGGPSLSQDYLLPQMYRLAEHNQVIFYDQRGCGQSVGEITADTITLEKFVDDVDAVRQAFKCDKITVLGHSWGGFLAMKYAVSHPDKIDKLILSNTMAASSEEYALFVQEWSRRMKPYQDEIGAIQQTKEFIQKDPKAIENLHRLIFRTYCFNPESVDLINLTMSAAASVNYGRVNALLSENFLEAPFNIHSSLKCLNMPVLILHGDNDPVPPITAQHIHESIVNSKYILMKQCSHFPYVEVPELYFTHLKEFLSRTEPEG